MHLWPVDEAIEGPFRGFPDWRSGSRWPFDDRAPVHVPRGPFVSVYFAPILYRGRPRRTDRSGNRCSSGHLRTEGTQASRSLGGVCSTTIRSWFFPPSWQESFCSRSDAGITSPADYWAGGACCAGVCGCVVFLVTESLHRRWPSRCVMTVPIAAVLEGDVRSYGLTMVGLTPIAWLMALAYVFIGPLVAFVFALPLYTTRAAYKSVVDIRKMFTQTIERWPRPSTRGTPRTRKHSRTSPDRRGDRPGHGPQRARP